MCNTFPIKILPGVQKSFRAADWAVPQQLTCSKSSWQHSVNQKQHIIFIQCICERDFITVAVSAFKEKWYTQNVTGRSHLELQQEGESTFSYFSSIFDKKLWRVTLPLGGIYPIQILKHCLYFCPNRVYIWRMKPVTLLSYITFDWKTRLSWFKVLLVYCQHYHLSRLCAKISPNLRTVSGTPWLWLVLIVCVD